MWDCQTGLQQVLIRRSARPMKPSCPWVHDEKLLAEDCSWVCALHKAKKCCLLLPPQPTHPISFFSAPLERARRLPPAPRRHPQGQEGSPETLSSCALSHLSCDVLWSVLIILRFWRRTGVHRTWHSMRHVQGAALEKEYQGCDNLEGKKPGHWMTTVCFSR